MRDDSVEHPLSRVTVRTYRSGKEIYYWARMLLRLSGVTRLVLDSIPITPVMELRIDSDDVRIDADVLLLSPTVATSVKIDWAGPVTIEIKIQRAFLERMSLDEPHM